MTVDWSQHNVNEIYEYINRRWVEEFGHYPDGDEPMSIVMVVAILAEYHDQVCPAATPVKKYLKAVPNRANGGTLNPAIPLPMQTTVHLRRRRESRRESTG